MRIQSLLNPFTAQKPGHHSPAPMPTSCAVRPYSSMPKRQKIAKDAPIFSEGVKINGFVNYPPHEADTEGEDKKEAENLAKMHRFFRIFPMGEIQKKGVRHIPYNSDKKDFMEKTGREAFEMFQYTFRVPGAEKEYVVVWDYNVGLVRMTPFFKSLHFSKTIPAKAMKENPGLKDISYSITGGALVCQGYWMPYQAAKALAATFCWNIRYALTPVFGNDFPNLCLPPGHQGFEKFLIDPEIVQFCTEETNRFRIEGPAYQVRDSTPKRAASQQPSFQSPHWDMGTHHLRDSDESGSYTESDKSSKYFLSPQVSPRSTTFRSVNESLSPASSPVFHSFTFDGTSRRLPHLRLGLPTSVPEGYYKGASNTPNIHSNIVHVSDQDKADHWSRTVSPCSDMDYSLNESDCEERYSMEEIEAARALLQLSKTDKYLALPK